MLTMLIGVAWLLASARVALWVGALLEPRRLSGGSNLAAFMPTFARAAIVFALLQAAVVGLAVLRA